MGNGTDTPVASTSSAGTTDSTESPYIDANQEVNLMLQYTRIFTRELVFAVDLTTYVMETHGLTYENVIYPKCIGVAHPSNFDDTMKTVMGMLSEKYGHNAAMMIEKRMNLDEPDYDEFKRIASVSAVNIEVGGYREFEFLVFCSMITQLCAIAYLHGLTKAPDFGIMLICRIFDTFRRKRQLPVLAWQKLSQAAKNFIEVSKPTPEKESV